MKTLTYSSLLVLSALCVWQFFTLRDIPKAGQSSPATEPVPTASADARRSKASRTLPTLPKDLLSADQQAEYMRKVAALEDPMDRKKALQDWARSFATPNELRTALDALLAMEDLERTAVMNLFGPPLLSQWGIVDPEGGLQEWAKAGYEDQWRLNGGDPELMYSDHLTASPIPASLLTSWSANDFDGFVLEFTAPDSVLIGDELRHTLLKDKMAAVFETATAQQPVENLVGTLATNAQRIAASKGVHMASLVPSVSTRLLEEQGGLSPALSAAEALPRTPVQESIVMDLQASRVYQEMHRQFEAGGKSAVRTDQPLFDQIRTSFLESDPLAQSQFFNTLKTEYSVHNGNRDLYPFSESLHKNTEWKDFQKELFDVYVENDGFNRDRQLLIPHEIHDLY